MPGRAQLIVEHEMRIRRDVSQHHITEITRDSLPPLQMMGAMNGRISELNHQRNELINSKDENGNPMFPRQNASENFAGVEISQLAETRKGRFKLLEQTNDPQKINTLYAIERIEIEREILEQNRNKIFGENGFVQGGSNEASYESRYDAFKERQRKSSEFKEEIKQREQSIPIYTTVSLPPNPETTALKESPTSSITTPKSDTSRQEKAAVTVNTTNLESQPTATKPASDIQHTGNTGDIGPGGLALTTVGEKTVQMDAALASFAKASSQPMQGSGNAVLPMVVTKNVNPSIA